MRSPRPLRPVRLSARLAPLGVAALVLLAACGDEQADESTSTDAPSATTAADGDSDSGDGDGDVTATTAAGDDTPEPTMPANVPPKPDVQIPEGEVSELTITDLEPGDGPEAADGDTVVVHYVGVRSEDGTEFDNSYDRGSPFSVTLGQGRVIQGWDQGLVGARAGMQRQLDIPADLAYGDTPQGDVIQPGDALTFVVDVVAVLPKSDPADAPDVSIATGEQVDSLQVEDLEAGEGDAVQPGQNVAFDYLFFRADTGEQLDSSWETGALQTLPFDEAQLPPVLYDALDGVKVGTLRQGTIPFADAANLFPVEGDTDIVLVVDVVAIY